MSFNFTNVFFGNVGVTVQIADDPSSRPKLASLNLTDNLSKIRKQLKKDNIINDALLFSRKYLTIDDKNDEVYGFAEITLESEKDFLLKEIVDEKENLYLIKSSIGALTRKLSQDFTSLNLSSPTPDSLEIETQQMIQQLKLNHGIFLDGYNIRPSNQTIFVETGELNLSLYKEQPIVYTNINDPDTPMKDDFNNVLQPSDVCINFPIAEITYEAKNLSDSFLDCMDHDETLRELYGDFFARKILVGGKLFIKEFSSATPTQIDILKFYLFHAYNLAKHSTGIQSSNLFALNLLPKIETLDGEELNTHEKLANWMDNLYQKNMIDIISYDNLIPTSQLKTNAPSEDNFENQTEKQPGVANFKEKLRLEEWVGNAACNNLVKWVEDFHLLQYLVINNYYKIEISKKVAANFVKIPRVESSDGSCLEIIRPKTKVEEFLILNNIFTIKDINKKDFRFINKFDDQKSYSDYNFLVKFGRYEINIDKDHVKPSEEFERAVEKALKSMKPFKALQDVFDKYGHLFPQKIILGRFFRRNIPDTSNTSLGTSILNPPTFESLKSHLDDLNISYLLTRKGNIIEANELSDIIQNLNNDLEIIEFDKVIPLYQILEEEQQRKIDNIFILEEQRKIENIFSEGRIIMTGITYLKDLNNSKNTEHYKRISVKPSLEAENYEVFGSIISKDNSKLQEFVVTFGLYDFNGFSAMINQVVETNVKINECCILWIVVGNPSELLVFSPNNRDFQVKYFKEPITLEHEILNIKTPFSLSQNDIISFNAKFKLKNMIRLNNWTHNSIEIEIIKSNFDESTPSAIFEINICILSSDYEYLKIDNREGKCHLNLIGDILTENRLRVEIDIAGKRTLGLIDIPFAQFVPLIKDVADILNKVNDLYSIAQHNKNIVKLLMIRISTANSIISILREDDIYTLKHYSSLQKLIQVIQKMKNFTEEITQYNTLQKFLGFKKIETQFDKLCKEYDSGLNSLDLNITIKVNINKDKENSILQEEIKDLIQFQLALAESMNKEATDTNMEIDDTDQKVSETKDMMNALVEKISEMAITMQSLDEKGENQNRIDNIFCEPLLPFEAYEETPDAPRSVRLRKYVHVKTRQEFAFKTVIKDCVNQVKNQVTILKKLKECQNIIHFYGLTFDGDRYYLVTEWAENKNLREYIAWHGQDIKIGLRIRFAYDIAKGLNFLNAVKMVHRDIRAENIVITEYDVAKITNFKLSRGVEAATVNLAVNEERVRYSAPEILRRMLTKEGEVNKKYDINCEVYSFGIVLWEIAECRVSYENFDDFTEISKHVVSGYREPFTPGTDIPSAYQVLVNQAVDQNPGLRPTFAKMLTVLNDLKKHTYEHATGHSGRKLPVQKMSKRMISEVEDCALLSIDNAIDKAVEEHKKNTKDKKILYKTFDTYANLGVPIAKFWKAYFILKGHSDLTCSENEKLQISAKLLKEVADYGDDYPDAQLRYATMVMQGRGVDRNVKEAIEYFRKASNNDHVVAMFNLGTYYFSNNNEELGKFYLAKAAGKKYDQAIQFCKTKNISY